MTPPEPTSWERPRTWELIALAGIIALFVGVAMSLVMERSPLGHDEAVYALRARYYAGGYGESAGYWNDYRAIGLPMIMRLIWPIGDTDAYARSVVVLIAALGIVLTWVWARRFVGSRAALLAAALLCVFPIYVGSAFRIYVDVPAATFGLAAILVYALAIRPDRAGVRPWAIAAAPIAGLATLTRYGAPSLVASGLVVVTVAYWRSCVRSWKVVALTAVGTAAACGAIVFVPRVTDSQVAPFIAFNRRQVAKDIGAFASYGDFFDAFPDVLGPIVKWLIVVSAIVGVILLVRRAIPPRPIAVSAAITVLTFVVLNAALAEGEPRYLVPMLPFLVVTVSAAVAPLLDRLPAAVAVAGLLLLLVFGSWRAHDTSRVASDVQKQNFGLLERASDLLRARDHGDCVVLTGYSPQVGWYSGCEAIGLPTSTDDPETFLDAVRSKVLARVDVDDDTPVYWLFADGGKRQPKGAALRALEEATLAVPIELGVPNTGKLRHLEVGLLGTYGEVASDP